jgi:2'-5' RNA ligase
MTLSFPLHSAFLALPLENVVQWRFRALQDSLRPFEDCFSFQNPESPHLTLYFWHELLKIEYEQMLVQMGKIADGTVSFSLEINGVDTFGPKGNEKILFLTVAFSPELATLKKKMPWPNPPDKPFHPHITLARIKHPQRFDHNKKKIMKVLSGISIDFPVTMVRFYAEIDRKKQTELDEFPFQLVLKK